MGHEPSAIAVKLYHFIENYLSMTDDALVDEISTSATFNELRLSNAKIRDLIQTTRRVMVD